LFSPLKACQDQFKEFERKDVKYREDLKHLKQKIKRQISVRAACVLVDYFVAHPFANFCFTLPESKILYGSAMLQSCSVHMQACSKTISHHAAV